MIKLFKRKKETAQDIQRDLDKITKQMIEENQRIINEYYKGRR